MIIDYKLTYPSGTATAVLINGFHTPKGDKMAKYICIHYPCIYILHQKNSKLIKLLICCRKQVVGFTKFFSMSFMWACFQWFYSGSGTCGFTFFPTFGLKAFKNSWVLVFMFSDFD